ncbi:hypothetical protein D2E25_1474 [Bifidobacterium goeldii]|uniref:YjbE family integral membrane protein n=1 Tax=Bifidobacterium goeldii TaxID=2306975 RepID=A0A430FJ35_9BIFI|nr:hypothetical protein [Bifidobacterium goeldii]RSX52903.1 hypothetical protein D2E25_1474 [Bifidobacterium goeldii]
MDYESLSTIIVLVILVIIAVGWLPRRTVNGMKRVVEHREDRYSSSLHLVDASSGTRFSDERTPRSKGAIMQPVQTDTAKLSPSKVAHIRQLRRAAFRRRRILVGALLAVTLLVVVLAVTLHFSALFALIPGAALALVLAFGVRASRHARAWEQEVARARRLRTRAQRDAAAASATRRPQVSQTASAAPAESDHADATGVKTDVMEGREIRQALRRAEMEQQRALAAREARRNERAQQEAAARAETEAASASEPQIVDAEGARDSAEVSAVAQQPADAMPQQTVDVAAGDSAGSAVNAADSADASAEVVVVDGAERTGDLTTELHQVHPAAALDAFEVAASQDLISFSLGAPRNGVEHRAAEPESLEIKSTKQVAKAVPVAEPAAVDTADDAVAHDTSTVAADQAEAVPAEAQSEAQDAAEASDENSADATGAALMASNEMVNDTAAFHETEMASSVDAPAATSDSLGTGLEAILARRSA